MDADLDTSCLEVDLFWTSGTASGLEPGGSRPSMAAAEIPDARAELDLAAADLAAGKLREAFDRVRTLLGGSFDQSRSSAMPRALALLGQIALVMEQPGAALGPLQRAVALDPKLEYRVWLSLCLEKLGCREDALGVVAAAIETIPPTADAHFAVGMVLHALDSHADAATCFSKCAMLDPTRAAGHYRYARSLQAAGRMVECIAAYAEAVRLCGNNANYFADFSSALSDAGRFAEACAAGRAAVAIDPGCVVGQNNLGHALHNLNRSAEALAPYERAIEEDGNYARAQFGYAVALLKSGDFGRGWAQYEWRWRDCQRRRIDLAAPVWEGEDPGGRTILLHAEQGLGDTLQFVRFAPLVAARGGRVVLEVQAPLVRLMSGVEGVAQVIARGDPVPPIDLHCPMASLPLAFGLRPEAIPAAPYLRVPADESARQGDAMRRRLLAGAGREDIVVGLVWAGDPRRSERRSNLIDRRRSVGLEALAPLLDVDGVRFVSLQFGEAAGENAARGRPLHDAMEGVADFFDTAARLAGIDLLISVDTSMVHLAGGLGMPVWMLSRFDGCWRWLEGRDETPWYPSMRIFRQPSAGDWGGMIAAVAAALRDVISKRRPWFDLRAT